MYYSKLYEDLSQNDRTKKDCFTCLFMLVLIVKVLQHANNIVNNLLLFHYLWIPHHLWFSSFLKATSLQQCSKV